MEGNPDSRELRNAYIVYAGRFAEMNPQVTKAEADYVFNVLGDVLDRKIEFGEETDELVIIDYGCAHGRFLDLYVLFAESIGIKVKIIGVEITKDFLEDIGNSFKKVGYTEIMGSGQELHEMQEDGTAYAAPWLVSDDGNIKVGRIHVSTSDSTSHIKQVLSEYVLGEGNIRGEFADVVKFHYGVLSQIPGTEYRTAVLKMVTESVKDHGEVVATLANRNTVHLGELGVFDALRQQLSELKEARGSTERIIELEVKLGLAAEPGDLYYERPGVGPRLFYHTFTEAEILAMFDEAGLKVVKKTGVMMGAAKDIAGDIEKRNTDSLRAARVSPDQLFETVTYINFRTTPDREKKIEVSTQAEISEARRIQERGQSPAKG